MASLLPYLRLVRAGALFSPGCDVLAGLSILGLGWSAESARLVAASILVYAGGMVLNDVADVREDRRQRPERPIPRGDIGIVQAALLACLLLFAGMWSAPESYRLHYAVLVGGVICYDLVSKRWLLAAALTMAALRGLNLLAAGAPLWIGAGSGSAMPQALLLAACCYAVYIFAVTILGSYEDQPPANPRAIVAVQTAPPLAAVVGLLAVQGGPWPAPTIAALLAVAFLRRNRRVGCWDRSSIRGSMTLLLLGTMLYTGLLCAAADRYLVAAVVFLCVPVAKRLARRISLT
jgi:hypothetical protein